MEEDLQVFVEEVPGGIPEKMQDSDDSGSISRSRFDLEESGVRELVLYSS